MHHIYPEVGCLSYETLSSCRYEASRSLIRWPRKSLERDGGDESNGCRSWFPTTAPIMTVIVRRKIRTVLPLQGQIARGLSKSSWSGWTTQAELRISATGYWNQTNVAFVKHLSDYQFSECSRRFGATSHMYLLLTKILKPLRRKFGDINRTGYGVCEELVRNTSIAVTHGIRQLTWPCAAYPSVAVTPKSP